MGTVVEAAVDAAESAVVNAEIRADIAEDIAAEAVARADAANDAAAAVMEAAMQTALGQRIEVIERRVSEWRANQPQDLSSLKAELMSDLQAQIREFLLPIIQSLEALAMELLEAMEGAESSTPPNSADPAALSKGLETEKESGAESAAPTKRNQKALRWV